MEQSEPKGDDLELIVRQLRGVLAKNCKVNEDDILVENSSTDVVRVTVAGVASFAYNVAERTVRLFLGEEDVTAAAVRMVRSETKLSGVSLDILAGALAAHLDKLAATVLSSPSRRTGPGLLDRL